MRVLVVHTDQHESESIAATLDASAHVVVTVQDTYSAGLVLAREQVDVLVLGWESLGSEGVELVRLAVAVEPRVYVIAVLDPADERSVARALALGVDDIQRKPIFRDEFVHRVTAPARFAGWSPQRFTLLPAPSVQRTDVAALSTWAHAEQLVATDFGALVGGETDTSPCEFDLASGIAAQVSLFLPNASSSIHITVGVDRSSLTKIGGLLFEDAPLTDEALTDVVLELANTAAGALSRAATTEGASFTMSLPFVAPLPVGSTGATVAERSFATSIEGTGTWVTVRIELVNLRLDCVTPDALREGMVLASDVVSEEGALLVSSGTRLTEVVAHHLQRVLGPRTPVEIALLGGVGRRQCPCAGRSMAVRCPYDAVRSRCRARAVETVNAFRVLTRSSPLDTPLNRDSLFPGGTRWPWTSRSCSTKSSPLRSKRTPRTRGPSVRSTR